MHDIAKAKSYIRYLCLAALPGALLVTLALLQLHQLPAIASAQTVLGRLRSNGQRSKLVVTSAQSGYDWPQLQGNPQRTGLSAEVLGTNFKVAWTHPFQPEKIYPQVQAIIYTGSDSVRKVYVGTEMGNLYVFNATSGAQIWKFKAGGPILSSVAAGNGTVYFGSMDGSVYAVGANTGTQVWKSTLSWRLGFSTAPVLADNKVMIGGRDGNFYGLDPNTGATLWQINVGAPILQSAAWDSGSAFFGAMNMYFYAINSANGTVSWKSQKATGMAFKDYWPVVTAGKVLVRAMAWQPEQRNFYAFDEATGNQTIALPQYDGQTMNGATTPPCVDVNGYLVVPVQNPNNIYLSGWGRLNLANQQIIDILVDPSNQNAGFGNGDENLNPTCATNLIIGMHTEEYNANYTGAFDLNSRKWILISHGWTNGQLSSNTQGGGGNPASISNGMIYHISYHELIARTTQ